MMIMEGVFFLFVILAAVGSLVSEYVKGVHFSE
jgi:hypothetical protein